MDLSFGHTDGWIAPFPLPPSRASGQKRRGGGGAHADLAFSIRGHFRQEAQSARQIGEMVCESARGPVSLKLVRPIVDLDRGSDPSLSWRDVV